MSERTTNFGPRVSFSTTNASGNIPLHLFMPSTGTFENAGTGTFSGTQTFSGNLTSTSTFNQTALASVFLSKETTASYTSLTLADGEFSIGSVSVGSATLYFRSGSTMYQWDAQDATIL